MKEQCYIDELKEAVVADMPKDEMEQYVALSRELGIVNPKARLEEFKAFLAENGITVYPEKRVDSYLQDKARKEGGADTYWCWKPLRKKDQRASFKRPVESSGAMTAEILRSMAQQMMSDQRFMMGLGGGLAAAQQSALGMGTTRTLPHGSLRQETYTHSVPMAVLMTVKKVSDAFPDAQFFASDYAVQNPDPFLAVTLPELEDIFIIERWDEPGFRM